MTNTTLDLIKKRVSVNLYDDTKTMDDADIRKLVEYASESPSSFNFQNWHFIAVKNPAAKERLKAVAYGQPKVSQAAVTFIVIGLLNPHKKLGQALAPAKTANIIDQATIDTWQNMANGMYEGNHQLQRDEAVRSASLAAMTMMIAAEAMGYGAGAMIGFDPVGVSKEFSLTEDQIPVMLLTVGPVAAGNWARKPRTPVSEILSIV